LIKLVRAECFSGFACHGEGSFIGQPLGPLHEVLEAEFAMLYGKLPTD
jgi:hypothetical protein